MNLNAYSPHKVFLLLFYLSLSLSCSKDSDLFSEYVLADSLDEIENRNNGNNSNETSNEDETPVEDETPAPESKLPTSGENIYYVTANGNSGNNGKTEANSWDIRYAFSTARAGDIIYIKAGNYGSINLSISNSGTSSDPIRFVGYRANPGDIVSDNGSTFKYGTDSFNVDDYPTLMGSRTGGNVSGTAFNITGNFVELHNIQIKDKERGISSYGSNNKLINVVIHDMGNHSGYSGTGVIMNGSYSELRNSFILNGVQLFTNTRGDNQVIDHNWLGCDQDVNSEYSTDYYLLLTGSGGNGADNNTVSNNTIYREPGQFHQGHGLIIKGSGQYNSLINNKLQNCPIELSFEEVAYNTVRGGSVSGTGATGDGGNVKYAFVLIANGAHHNNVDGITFTGDSGIRFSDWNDGWTPSPDTDAVSAGHDNTITNCVFDGTLSAIEFAWHWYGPGSAVNNVFENCTFKNIKSEIFRTERPNSGTVLRNCSFVNNTGIYNQDAQNTSRVTPSGKKSLNVTYENCTWTNNSFAQPY
ncbi:hypothetical protein [Flagellimonas flava]|uniref:Right handed beta helix region n=1 Tax=Flagellimonas flava TaxID=570519 RepID=A0A1M5J5Z0_9FLAO|nr:hypothetical protein [Allomuricauda flava]SHG36018.1 hypothetical protein SAMN04488116_1152 [Allomuricauda flava]